MGEVLRQAIEESQMSSHLDELRAAERWPLIVGPDIADRCCRPYIEYGRMTIRVPESGLRHELFMCRSRLLEEFNRLAGKQVVKSLRLTP